MGGLRAWTKLWHPFPFSFPEISVLSFPDTPLLTRGPPVERKFGGYFLGQAKSVSWETRGGKRLDALEWMELAKTKFPPYLPITLGKCNNFP